MDMEVFYKRTPTFLARFLHRLFLNKKKQKMKCLTNMLKIFLARMFDLTKNGEKNGCKAFLSKCLHRNGELCSKICRLKVLIHHRMCT